MQVFVSNYKNMQFYDSKGQLKSFSNGKFVAEDKADVKILENCLYVKKEVDRPKKEEPKKDEPKKEDPKKEDPKGKFAGK